MFTSNLRDPAAAPLGFGIYEDFIRQDGIVDLGAFDFTAIASGTIATSAANGGIARLSGVATTDATGAQLQAQGCHVVTDGKFLSFKARCQINESTSTNGATESQLYLGLFPVDTSIDASLPADGIYFDKIDGATAIRCIVRVASSNVFVTTITNVADKSMHTYGIGITPVGTVCSVEFTIDGVRVARVDGVAFPASSIILTPSVAFRAGDATGTKFLDVDYMGSWQDR